MLAYALWNLEWDISCWQSAGNASQLCLQLPHRSQLACTCKNVHAELVSTIRAEAAEIQAQCSITLEVSLLIKGVQVTLMFKHSEAGDGKTQNLDMLAALLQRVQQTKQGATSPTHQWCAYSGAACQAPISPVRSQSPCPLQGSWPPTAPSHPAVQEAKVKVFRTNESGCLQLTPFASWQT